MIRWRPDDALVVVDVQNDFADPAGSLAVSGGREIVPVIDASIRGARARGALVVATGDWHPPRTPHFAIDGGPWPVHCVAGTWGAEFVAGFSVDGPVVRKGSNGEDGYSGFTMRDPETGATRPTELESILRAAEVRRVVVCGLATDYCVAATARDAVALGFPTTVLVDAVRAVDVTPGDGQRALDDLVTRGVTLERAGRDRR